jgi:hypothetical protein
MSTGGLEGAGVLSSWSGLADAVAEDDPGLGLAGSAAALDTLGFVADPLESLAAAGFGWAIEHLGFLREPLDALAGRPGEVLATARAWHGVADELAAVAEGLRGQLPDVAGWSGAAGDAYRAAARRTGDRLDAGAAQAGELAALVLRSGVDVATTRAYLRDLAADAAAEALVTLLVSAAGGVSVAAGIAAAVADAVQVAWAMARQVARLLDRLTGNAAAAERLVLTLADLAGRATAALPGGVAGAAESVQVSPLRHAAGQADPGDVTGLLVERAQQEADARRPA